MPLTPGTKLGQYKVVEAIGKGGMGEVYRARDTKLGRDVAIKVLPEEFARDKERLDRFEREARLLAQLNHSNIATLYGLEEHDGQQFIVMELVEGETLAERIAKGSIPVDEAIPLFIQIAEGLEAAHEKAIIHRDLKPANIKIGEDGKPKILDFGLAKALAGEAVVQDLSQSPTLTRDATETGVLLGTAPYMSPEQARGKTVDKRTDVWAFGCCLYEALTGKAAFVGETVSDTIGKILEREPDWQALPAGVPALVRSLLRRSLQKVLTRRLQDIGDARIEIEESMAEPADSLAPVVQRSRWRTAPWVFLGLITVAFLILLVGLWRGTPVEEAPMRFNIQLSPDQPISRVGQAVALSPGGGRLAYAAELGERLQQHYGALETQIYLRSFDQVEPRSLPGTEGVVASVFFSPDGQWLGFADRGGLKKISSAGGAAVSLADGWLIQGASWGPDDTIIFNRLGRGLWRISASGGTPEQITIPEAENESHRYPQFLPDGKAVLFSAGPIGRFDEADIVVQSLATGERKVLHRGGYYPHYVPTGHLVFLHNGSLFAAPFDVDRLEVTALPRRILEHVWSDPQRGSANFALSQTGTLVYEPRGEEGALQRALIWVDREGQEELLAAELGAYHKPRISPDGSHVAVSVDSGNWDVWIYDLARETSSRLTFDPATDRRQVWTPDGQRVVFSSRRNGGVRNLFWKAADGTGMVERLTTSDYSQIAHSWSRDGKTLVFEQQNPETVQDLYVLSMDGERSSKPLLQTEFTEDRPAISPDGRWIAYRSNESGRFEIYVRPFPNVEDGKWMISTDGGISPVWGPHGREIFYRSLDDGAMIVARVQTEPTFTVETPVVLFTGSYYRSGDRNYDISPDGRRFLMLKEVGQTADPETLVVVLNWFEELKRLVPTDK